MACRPLIPNPWTYPRLILIADRFTDPAVAEPVIAAVDQGGVRWVQLRDHQAASDVFRRTARWLVHELRKRVPDVRISVNRDIALAKELQTGVHLGTQGPTVAEARAVLGPEAIMGYSAHQGEARRDWIGTQYLFFSPIFPTLSKPGHSGTGLSPLKHFCEAVAVPVYALGGITPAQVDLCRQAGAYGVAVVSGILQAPNPVDAARRFLGCL